MIIKKEDLKIPVKVKTISGCNYSLQQLKGSNYKPAIRFINYLSKDKEDGGLGFDIHWESDSDKIFIFCEKSEDKEIRGITKNYWN